jgi:hypothetical protein
MRNKDLKFSVPLPVEKTSKGRATSLAQYQEALAVTVLGHCRKILVLHLVQ